MDKMFNIIIYCLSVLVLSCLLPNTVYAANNFVAWDKKGDKWLQQSSAHFSVNYLRQHQKKATQVLKIAEQVHQELHPFFKVTPTNPTQIILLDDIDYLRLHESTLEYGEIRLVMSPPTNANAIELEDNWVHFYLAHEYSYILQMQLSQGTWRGLFISAEFTPAMLLEGVAIYLEKNNKLTTESLSSSSFQMQMRMQVIDDHLKDLQKVIIRNREWPLTSTYIYGAFFIDYLAQTYGEENLLTFLENYSRHLFSYPFLNKETNNVFNKDFLTLWQEFKIHLEEEFSEQIHTLEKNNVNGELISTSPFIQIATDAIDGLLVNKITGEDRHQIQQYQQQNSPKYKWKTIAATNQLRSMDSHPQAGLITTRNINYVNGKQYNDIYLYTKGNWQRLTEQARFKHVRFMPDGKSILATSIIEGLSELWLIKLDQPESAIKIWQGQDNVILGEFDIAPNAQYLVASMKAPLSQWKLAKFDLITKQWHYLTQRNGHENSPLFLPDGALVYSATYSGVSNIYRLDMDKNNITQWTNVVGGAFHPLWQNGLGLVFQSYGTKSYMIRHIENPIPINTLPLSEGATTITLKRSDEGNIKLSEPIEYSTWATVQPHSWLPIYYVDTVRSLIGLNTYGGDALGRHNYELYALWDAKNQLASYFLEYRYDNRWSLGYLRDYKFKNISLDASKPDYQISTNQTYLLERSHLLSAWEDKLSLHIGGSMSFDSLFYQPDFVQAIETVENEAKEITLGVAITFDNQEYYLNVPSVGWGHYYDFTFEENILDSDFSGQKYQTQWRATWDLPGRTTIMTRLAAGLSSSDAKRYTLGGNNLKNEMNLFDRNSQAIRGYDDIALQGHHYFTQRIELNSWLGRFERNWGIFPLGMGDIAGTLFLDSGTAWDAGESLEPIMGIGAQLQLEFKLGYNYSLPINLGYAYGTDKQLGKDYLYLNFGSSY
ncbi:hypothetical protein GCM10007916_30250 [Psychromonas marina]|uniref:Bacterial surface antigen (D15) domain-containing protein n=1 Tax=Psychromonas marina TaxID=88364 RepID=A0ABQ6E434_9GAMM|nr:hypothetical protein [Psychromonas marina]GLS91955.1 hypothetical protein GCM10007916_30250 [Psychromonas marina]